MPHTPNIVGTAAVTENLLKRKWSAVILRYMASGISDPTEIGKNEASLSTAAMNERLRNMQRFGLITRFHSASSAKVVEYRMTARGHKILKLLNFIDQLDSEAGHDSQSTEERVLVAIRRTKIAASAKKRLILKD